jgi:hypothetical protein
LGAILIEQEDLDATEQYLAESIGLKATALDHIGIPELLVWLGRLAELRFKHTDASVRESTRNRVARAESYYQCCLTYRWIGRRYFECGALTGMVRVKYAQGDTTNIAPFIAEAEELAQMHEYNDHLALLRFTQSHPAWDGLVSDYGAGFDAKSKFYQHALIHSLRYNRFLLDEVLLGRPQGTAHESIVPLSLERGPEGLRMHRNLRDWCLTGFNDIRLPRPSRISPIPEAILLCEAERKAREREIGDGSPQKTLAEKISMALVENNW